MELTDKEAVVKNELHHLLTKHSLTEAISAIDEIVLNYVLGVLECLDEDVDESEDVEPFAETMEAYLPGFAAVVMADVGEWMLSTAKRISKAQNPGSRERLSSLLPPDEEEEEKKEEEDRRHTGNNPKLPTASSKTPFNSLPLQRAQPPQQHLPQGRGRSSSEEDAGACGEKRVVVLENIDSDSVATLRELCPAASMAELQHCLHMSGGSVEEAACLLLFRQESGTAITVVTASKPRKKSSANGSSLQTDESLKDSLLAKYSFVDTSEDTTEHRPELFAKEQKKMVRYREGQVVSTKGERFSEIKKQESEEMKKTYVSLKPQRKYRFH